MNGKNATGDIPLFVAQNEQILKLFHDSGCGMDALDIAGMTPLHHAVLTADLDRAADLIKLGFNPLTPDSRGITSRDLAEGILNEEVRTKMIAVLQNTDFR